VAHKRCIDKLDKRCDCIVDDLEELESLKKKDCEIKEKKIMKSKRFIYGRNNTIHRTKILNIEIDEKTKEVVSVWFRCMALPFDINKVDRTRANEMKKTYKENKMIQINAIEIEEEE